MPEIAVYLLKANLGILLFYIGYVLFLRKLTFYQLNRFYFLFGLIFSMLYPAIDFSFLFNHHQLTTPVQAWIPNWQQLSQAPADHDMIWNVVLCFLLCTGILFAIRFLIRLSGLYRIHKASVPAIFTFYRYRKVMLRISPFSFWKTIYVNPEPYDAIELENILKHEFQHVSSFHTFDILLTEIVSFFCWFNPTIWLIKYAIRENLEYITDQRVLNSGTDRKQYQYSLVKVLTSQQHNALASHFNLKNLKRRIWMMNKDRSSLFNLGKYIFTIPIIVLFSLIFTLTKAYEGVQTNASLPIYTVDGKEFHQDINTLDSNDIESVTVYKNSDTNLIYGPKGKKGVVKIKMRNRTTQTGVNSEHLNPVEIQKKKSRQPDPIYLVNGISITALELKLMKSEDIQSINVIKDGTSSGKPEIHITLKSSTALPQ